MAYPDDLDYTAPERLELLGVISAAVKTLVQDAERSNANYGERGRAALKAAIEAAISTALPPAA